MKMKNKKAQIFEGFWVLVTLVVLSMALGTFMMVKTKVQAGVTPSSELMNIYNEKDKTEFYNEEYLKLAVQEAYYNVLKTGAVDNPNCNIMVADYVNYNDGCNSSKSGVQEYLKKELTKINRDIIMDDNIIRLKSENISKTMVEKGYINYEINFAYNPSVEIKLNDLNISLDDLGNVYTAAITCKSMNLGETKECMSKKVGQWNIEIKESGKYVLYDLTTKISYFFDNKFEPMALKFSLDSWFI